MAGCFPKMSLKTKNVEFYQNSSDIALKTKIQDGRHFTENSGIYLRNCTFRPRILILTANYMFLGSASSISMFLKMYFFLK